MSFMYSNFFVPAFFSVVLLSSCNFIEGIDTKKTGLSRNCQSIEESKWKEVFQYELCVNSNNIQLNNETFELKNAWIEYGWSYESVDGEIKVTKNNYSKFILDFENLSQDKFHKFKFKHGNSYLGWNGVLFSTLKKEMDTIKIIISSEGMNDTLFTLKLFKGHCK